MPTLKSVILNILQIVHFVLMRLTMKSQPPQRPAFPFLWLWLIYHGKGKISKKIKEEALQKEATPGKCGLRLRLAGWITI